MMSCGKNNPPYLSLHLAFFFLGGGGGGGVRVGWEEEGGNIRRTFQDFQFQGRIISYTIEVAPALYGFLGVQKVGDINCLYWQQFNFEALPGTPVNKPRAYKWGKPFFK